MKTNLENPFVTGPMIRSIDQFVGRSREIRNILSRVNNGSPVSVVGPRRIGKSSLLYHLFLTGPQQLPLTGPWIYLSFHSPELKTQTGFCESVLDELGFDYVQEQIEKKPLVVLSKALKKVKKTHNPPILLLDEFEDVTKSKDLFTDDFFEALREFCNDGRLVVITASAHTLRELTDMGNLTSPFWNIFTSLRLGEYIVENGYNEPEEFRVQFWGKERLDGTPVEWKWLYGFHDTHPLVLQVVSDLIFRARGETISEDELVSMIENDLHSFFRPDREILKKWAKDRLKLIRKGSLNVTNEIGKHLDNLSPLTSFFGK